MPATSNIALSGKPPAKEMMPGLPSSLNSSRIAEVSTLLRRSAKGYVAMGHILSSHQRCDLAAPGAGLVASLLQQLLEAMQVALGRELHSAERIADLLLGGHGFVPHAQPNAGAVLL